MELSYRGLTIICLLAFISGILMFEKAKIGFVFQLMKESSLYTQLNRSCCKVMYIFFNLQHTMYILYIESGD